MSSNANAYFAIFRTELKTATVYLMGFLINIFSKIVRPLIMLVVWTAIFTNTHTSTIGGFTLSATYAYFFVISFLSIIFGTSVDQHMSDDVQNGAISSILTKPVRYPLTLLATELGDRVFDVLLVAVPLTAITLLVTRISITPTVAALLGIEILIGYSLQNVLAFLIGTFAVYFINIDGFSSMIWTVEGALAGSMIPLNFFPSYAQHILFLLPFQIVTYLPAVTLLGYVSFNNALMGIACAMAWTLALSILAYFWWGHVSTKISAVGG